MLLVTQIMNNNDKMMGRTRTFTSGSLNNIKYAC